MGGKMLTPRQFAARQGVAYTTVANWLQQGLIPEAVKRETPSGHYWEVPETATVPQLKVGRPRKPKEEAA
jgi:predicted site-specific integrase-resolvase